MSQPTTKTTCYRSGTMSGRPINYGNGYECPPHFYCPNSTASVSESYPQICPPSRECIVTRSQSIACEPQGVYEPTICPGGYYCPTPKDKIICPKGFRCPAGTIDPIECQPLSTCPEGSVYEVAFGGVLFCLVIDLILVTGYVMTHTELRSRIINFYRKIIGKPRISRRKSSDVGQLPRERDGDMEKVLLKGYTKAFTPESSSSNQLLAFPRLSFKFTDIKYQLTSGKLILNGVTGEIKNSRVTGILGASGSGKTTFLNVLMGKLNHSSGELLINGEKCKMQELKKIVGFVPQEDICLRELTVRENITHSADVRLPTKWSFKEKEVFVDAVIGLLGLTKVQNTIVGDEINRGISGGQRKRVNIAMELAAAPLFLALDEPTTGLDSTSAMEVCHILKSIAALGVTVVTVIHQPRFEIYEMLDDLLLLAPGGTTAYFGSRENALPHFLKAGFSVNDRQNIADMIVDSLNAAANDPELKKKLTTCITYDSDTVQKEPLQKFNSDDLFQVQRGASFLRQFYLCHQRSLKQQIRALNSLILEVFVALFAGLLMGLFAMEYDGELMRGMYVEPLTALTPSPVIWIIPFLGLLFGMSTSLSAAPAGVQVLANEKLMYYREASSGHDRFAYYLGKTVSSIYRIVLTSFHFAALFYILGKPNTSFAHVWAILFGQMFCVYGYAEFTAALVPRDDAALLAVVGTMSLSIFCGFGPNLADVRQWGYVPFIIWSLQYCKWATESMYWQELKVFDGVYQITSALDQFGYRVYPFWQSMLAMVAIGLVYRLFAYLTLISINRAKQR